SLTAIFIVILFFFFFQAEDGIRDFHVTGVQTCALPILEQSRRTQTGQHQYHEQQELPLQAQALSPARRPGRSLRRRRTAAENGPVVAMALGPGRLRRRARSGARHHDVPSRQASAGARRATVHAGYSAAKAPTIIASATLASPANSTSTKPGFPSPSAADMSSGASTVVRSGNASATPTSPPMPASTADSVTTSRTTRARVAPSARLRPM